MGPTKQSIVGITPRATLNIDWWPMLGGPLETLLSVSGGNL